MPTQTLEKLTVKMLQTRLKKEGQALAPAMPSAIMARSCMGARGRAAHLTSFA